MASGCELLTVVIDMMCIQERLLNLKMSLGCSVAGCAFMQDNPQRNQACMIHHGIPTMSHFYASSLRSSPSSSCCAIMTLL